MSGGLHLDDTACQALKDDAAALIAAAGQPIIVTMKPSGQYNEGQNTNVSLEIDITGNDGNGGCQTVRTVSDSFPIGRFDSIPKSPAFLTAEAGALYNAQKNIGILGTASATDSLTLACHDWNDLSWRIRFWSGQKLGQASAGIPFNRIWESPSEKVASL